MSLSANDNKRTGVLVVILMFIGLACWAGYKAGQWHAERQVEQLENANSRLTEAYAEVDKLTRQVNMLGVELEVEKLANADIKNSLREVHAQNSEQRRELSFFEKIMAPEREANGVSFDSFEITSVADQGRYRFRLVLTQMQRTKRFAKGQVSIVVQGTQDKEVISHDLMSLAGKSKSDAKFSFQYFTVFEGEFYLPEGFSPDAVAVKAIFPKNKWQKFDELADRFPWPVILD